MLVLHLLLLIVGAVLLVVGLATVATAPLMASRAASASARPKLERRASGPDRMRELITSQRTERSRSRTLASTLTRSGLVLGILAVLSLLGGVVAWFTGY
jgi:hypothetical protein